MLGLTQEWIILLAREPDRAAIYLLDYSQLRIRGRFVLEGRELEVGARIQSNRLLIFDSLGRVLILSLKSGHMLREFMMA